MPPWPGMGLDLLPPDIRERYQIDERRHACAVLTTDFAVEFAEILDGTTIWASR